MNAYMKDKISELER